MTPTRTPQVTTADPRASASASLQPSAAGPCPARRIRSLVVAIGLGLATLVGGLVAAPAANAAPRTIHVAPDGNDANPGSATRPKATLQGAAAALGGRGGVIEMRAGRYTWRNGAGWILDGGRKGTPLVVRPAPGAQVSITSTSDNFCVATSASHVVVMGLDCTGDLGMGSFGGSSIVFRNNRIHDLDAHVVQGIMIAGRNISRIRVIGNDIRNVGQTGIAIGEPIVGNTRNVVVKGNTVRRANEDFQSPSIGGGWGSGISVIGTRKAKIVANDVREIFGEGINCPLSQRCAVVRNTVVDTYNALFYADNTSSSRWEGNVGWTTGDVRFTRDYGVGPRVAAGVQFANETSWFSGRRNPTRGNVVRNNVFMDVERGFVFAGYEGGAAGMRNVKVLNNTFVRATCGIDIFGTGVNGGNEVRNNIVVPAPGGFAFCGSGAGTSFSNNLWASGRPGRARGAGDVRENPGFVGGSGVDPAAYRLAPGSPAIDAGTWTQAVRVDRDGTVRPQGASHDIGAYEFS